MERRRTAALLTAAIVLAGHAAGAGFAAHVSAAANDRRVRCAGVPATVVGTVGSDELEGTRGPDVVVAGDGDDTVDTGPGRDLVCLGPGFDLVRLGAGPDRAVGGAGDDTLHGGGGGDALIGHSDVDAMFGGPGDDRLRGGSGTSIIVEALIGGEGDDVLIGGKGLDSAQFFNSAHPVRVDLRRGRAIGDGTDSLVGIEGVVGSDHSDVIIGDAAGNGLFGQGGNDHIRAGDSGRLGRGTADVLAGDLGNDELAGGAGQDLVTYARIPLAVTVDLASGSSSGQGRDRLAGIEAVQGSIENDTLTGGPAADLLAGSLGDDIIDGAGARDTAIYRDVARGVEVRLASGSGRGDAAGNDTLTHLENVWGTDAADDLQGDEGRNRILAFDGDDRLLGFEGVDVLNGSSGTDVCEDAPAQLVNCEDSGARTSAGDQRVNWPVWALRYASEP